MKKYGLQLRVPLSQQKQQPTRRPLLPPSGFRKDDYDDDDAAERAVSWLASKSRALKEPKYITNLIKKAEERQRGHEIVYEIKIAKERSKDDHLNADKDNFVKSACKKKLAEQAKWMEEEHRERVTKKSDLSNFYFNLDKNVAYGSRGSESIKPVEKKEVAPDVLECCHHISPGTSSRIEPPRAQEGDKPDFPSAPEIDLGSKPDVSPAPRGEPTDAKHVLDVPPSQKNCSVEPPCLDQPKRDHHKRSEDAVTAAKERFLAWKRAKESLLLIHSPSHGSRIRECYRCSLTPLWASCRH